ncbi:MAG: hypothetical protein ACTHMS_22270 [Jatrophihabitans sp.]|uniref:hypothetical protein n=1 Tax=Jatrophihabitans sp. TaxID=1932789 RepID=UPI003F823F5C
MKRLRARESILDAINRAARESDAQGVAFLTDAYSKLIELGDADLLPLADEDER